MTLIFSPWLDWVGKFDYLEEYCKVVYLPRTEGVSSSDLRGSKRAVNLGLVGDSKFLKKVYAESKFVNGIHIQGICAQNPDLFLDIAGDGELLTSDYQALLERVDAVYIRSQPADHYDQIKLALEQGKKRSVRSAGHRGCAALAFP